MNGTTVTVYVSNNKYYFEADAIGRMSRILLSDCPGDVEIFRIISIYHGVPVRETQLLRSQLERVINYHGSVTEMRDSMTILDAPADNPVLDAQQEDYPRFGWSVFPRLARSFFDPKQPARFGLFADGSAYAELLPGITLETVVEANIYNNLGTTDLNNSLLPHVRSDFNQYYDKGATAFHRLMRCIARGLAPMFSPRSKPGIWKTCLWALAARCYGVQTEIAWCSAPTCTKYGSEISTGFLACYRRTASHRRQAAHTTS